MKLICPSGLVLGHTSNNLPLALKPIIIVSYTSLLKTRLLEVCPKTNPKGHINFILI